jgi:predicted transcriptional regulator
LKDGIPDDVRRFVLRHIGSVEMLNVLMLLFKQPDRTWTATEVGNELRTNEWSADLQLQALAARQLVRGSTGAPPRYQADRHYATEVATVSRTYEERRVAIITLIYSRPEDVVDEPVDPVQAFADAFKIRKDK